MPKDNRILILIGAGVAILAAVAIALMFSSGRDKAAEPPPASQGGLTVDVADAPGLDATRELNCYVDGRLVGTATLADCARRNGLATDALDVGVDESGALFSLPAPPTMEPPPIETAAAEPTTPSIEPTTPSAEPVQQAAADTRCLRYTGSDWRMVSASSTLNACVQTLYAGTCVGAGDALYGAWGSTNLRLVRRRVEQSSDNNRFRLLAEQDRSCQFPGLR